MAKRKQNKQKTMGYIFPFVILVVLALIAVVLFASRNNQTIDQSDIVLVDDLELGEQIYAQNCASCHGANLEGEPDWQSFNPDGTFKAPPHDANGHTWHHSDSYLLDRIRNGTDNLDANLQLQSNMPAYRDTLSDAEIEAVLAFIKNSWPEDIQQTQASR